MVEELKNDLLNLKFLSQSEQKDLQVKNFDTKFINPSLELNPKNIIPNLILVDSKHKEWKTWKSIEQHVSSFPFRRSPGRNNYFLVRNEYDGKNLGVIDIGADFLALGPRDRFIGWDKNDRILRNRNIANISICVPTTDFGYNLSGGKLLASLALSDVVANVWKEKYGDELVGLTVTSLYGRGTQYNRLKPFNYLGKTQGQGTVQIPEDLYQRLRTFVELNEGEIPGGRFTKGKNSRINIIRKACFHLGVDAKLITTHGHQRGIYWANRGSNTSDFLRGLTNNFIVNENLKVGNLTEDWRNNWANRRLKNLNLIVS